MITSNATASYRLRGDHDHASRSAASGARRPRPCRPRLRRPSAGLSRTCLGGPGLHEVLLDHFDRVRIDAAVEAEPQWPAELVAEQPHEPEDRLLAQQDDLGPVTIVVRVQRIL